jgi:hypothetical protein
MLAGDVTDHFVVTIPRDGEGEVVIAERLCAPSNAEATDTRVEVSRVMATLNLEHWLLIENEVRVEFNRRLRRMKRKVGVWRYGDNRLAPGFGQELTLLCWAIREAEVEQIANAYRNWAWFTPEERQWLYTTVAVLSPAPVPTSDAPLSDSAWRRAIRIALIETPDSDRPPRPEPRPEVTPPASKPTKEGLKSRKKRPDLDPRLAQPSLPCLE